MAKRKRESLSRERILVTALGLIDAEGLEAISMRRVGEALGVEAMSLYNHVANKGALLDGVFEQVLAELPPERSRGRWTTVLRRRARELRGVLLAHPHVLPLFATRPAVTPGALAQLERALEVLAQAGFSDDDGLSAVQVLLAFVVGHTMATALMESPAPSFYAGLDEGLPRLRALAGRLAEHDLEAEFELGLSAMLRGLEAVRAGQER